MSDKNEISLDRYLQMLQKISSILKDGRKQALSAVNDILIETYWNIGKEIVEYEQDGKEKAEYGSTLLDNISKDLKTKHGKGFSRRNVLDMRRFYLIYRNWQTVSAELSWSHYTLRKRNGDRQIFSPRSGKQTQITDTFFHRNADRQE